MRHIIPNLILNCANCNSVLLCSSVVLSSFFIHKGEWMLCYCVVGRISSYVCACSMSSLLHSGVSHASTYYAVAHRECEWRTQGGCCCSLGMSWLNATQLNRTNSTKFNPTNPNEGGVGYPIYLPRPFYNNFETFTLTMRKTYCKH